MRGRFLEIVSTPSVRAARAAQGVPGPRAGRTATPEPDALGPAEMAFIAARDSFYIASVSETGWPYVQHRGGPPGFLAVLGPRRLGFADQRGNRQYVTLGHISADPRVALILMDYPNRRRLKLLGRMRVVEGAAPPAERLFEVEVEAFDWNCPQHITPRFTEAELAVAMAPVRARLGDLEAENAALRQQLAAGVPRR